MSSRILIARRLTRAQPRALLLSGPARSFASTSQRHAGSLLSDDKAAEHDNRWKGTATNGGPTKLLIDGEWVNSTTNDWIDLHDPVRRSLPRLGSALSSGFTWSREGGRKAAFSP
jgi:malonate-semialdehyde dehydrogenase (acetylating)/methylmalonate-semialdehyde dehydrogenase